MRIVIVGAGQVGSYLAERLSIEGQDVVLVDSDAARVKDLQDSLDALVIHGNGATPSVLEEAGVANADMLIAVTSQDAVNVLVCQTGTRLGVPLKIARVEDPALRPGLEAVGVDVVIDPEATLAEELLSMVLKGSVSEVFEFGDGKLMLMGGFVPETAPVAGHTLEELRDKVKGWDWLVTALVRNGETTIARGDTTINAHDHVLLIAKPGQTDQALDFLGLGHDRAHKVVILGATRLAQLTAQLCAREGLDTLLIDEEADRCRYLAEQNHGVVVAQGDPTDPRVLHSEGVASADVVMALTGWDEVNVMGALLANALGVKTTVARFQRIELVSLLAGVGLDAAVSARQAAANAILRFVRRGRIHSVATFQDTDAEAIEIQVGPDATALGKTLADIHIPKTAIVGGVVRGGEAFVPRGTTIIEEGDRIIVIALPDAITTIEKTFGA